MYHFVHSTYNAWCIQVWKLATNIYAKSWKTHDIDIDEEFELASNPNKKRAEKKEEKKEPPEPTMIEDLGILQAQFILLYSMSNCIGDSIMFFFPILNLKLLYIHSCTNLAISHF